MSASWGKTWGVSWGKSWGYSPSSSGGGGIGKNKPPEYLEDFWNTRNPDAEHAAAMMRICMQAIVSGFIR